MLFLEQPKQLVPVVLTPIHIRVDTRARAAFLLFLEAPQCPGGTCRRRSSSIRSYVPKSLRVFLGPRVDRRRHFCPDSLRLLDFRFALDLLDDLEGPEVDIIFRRLAFYRDWGNRCACCELYFAHCDDDLNLS